MNSKQTEEKPLEQVAQEYGQKNGRNTYSFYNNELDLENAFLDGANYAASLPAAKPVKGAYVSGKTSWPNKRGSFVIRYQDGRIDNYFIDQPNDAAKETWFKAANSWLFEWWDKNATAEAPAKPVSEDVEEMIKRLHTLMPYHINPYNLGEMGEISIIISKLYNQIKSGYAAAPAKGMRWVKASERLPERKAEYFVIIDDYKAVVIFDGVNFFSDDNIVTKSVTRWLDESPSDSEAGDAVEFAEWLGENYDFNEFENKWGKFWENDESVNSGFDEISTIELYHQFKKQ